MNTKLNLRIYIVLIYCLLQSSCVSPDDIVPTDLHPFTTDGCSYYPDGTAEHPMQWKSCCMAHDKSYWSGGIRQERAKADSKFKQCVVDSGGGTLRAQMMWLAVRVAGAPIWPSSFRWSYGWPYYRGYAAITPAEQLEIDLKQAGHALDASGHYILWS